MQKQKFYTPLIKRKEKEEIKGGSENKGEEVEAITTQGYQQRQGINYNLLPPERIKSYPSFSLDKMSTRALEIAKTNLLPAVRQKQQVKLPLIRRPSANPEDLETTSTSKKNKSGSQSKEQKQYYTSNLYRCLKKHETTYLMSLYRQHFYQQIEVLRWGKRIKISHHKKELNLARKNPGFKTVFVDLDQTLIHCDENSNHYSVKLNFPLDRGGTLAAGVRIRPFCKEFLQQLSEFAEIIIFTASSASYADVILDYLDPDKKYISHRLYRQHCTLEKGYYLKDLRIAGRKLNEVVFVDNSPYCHVMQPDNAIPIVPYYHFAKDRELESLLEFLKVVVQAEDTRKVIQSTFFWDKFMSESGDARKLFLKYYQNKGQ